MKKFTLFLALFFCIASLMASKGYDVSFNQTKAGTYHLTFDLDDYQLSTVTHDGVTYTAIGFEGRAVTYRKGYAEVPFINAAVLLSPDKNVTLVITGGEYVEYDLGHPLLPSRGNLLRNQDPSTIPYEIDPASVVDNWYPKHQATATEPYIIRDVRGTTVYVYPFQYNAEKQVLRVYKNVVVELVENNSVPVNPINRELTKVSSEFNAIYNSMFINYNRDWNNEVEQEYGEMLVIYTSRDASVIQPYITWKKEMGFKVHEQQVSTGTNVVNTVQSAYDANNNILYVQLVGDWADLQCSLGGGANAPMDPLIGCVVGTDGYPDIFIGRFSASSTAHVTIQVNKTITFERDPETGGAWYSKAIGLASSEGAGIGDDDEIDYVHMGYIKDRLLSHTYTEVAEAYQGQNDGISAATGPINAGLTIINYVGHGSHSSWSTTGYSTSNASSASNGDKLPVCITVGCVVGEYHNGGDCLAEAMLKSTGGGCVGFLGSTINQSWAPPMIGQDYMMDLLIGGYDYSSNPGNGTSTTDELRTRFGPLTLNGCILMLNETSSAQNDFDTWCLFGDASLQLRTDQPEAITITNLNVTPGTYTTQITVGGNPFEGALVSLYQAGTDQPCAGLTDASGNVTITHSFGGTVKLTVTGYNLDTYQGDHTIQVPDPPVADFSADQTSVIEGETVSFTDLSTNYPSEWAWSFSGGTPNNSTVNNPSVMYTTAGTYDVSLTATNSAGTDSETKTGYITVTTNTTPPTADFEADNTNILVGQSVNFTDLSTGFPTGWLWTFDGGTPGTSTDQNPANITYTAGGDYSVTLEATNANGSDTETKSLYIHVIAEFIMDNEDITSCSGTFYDPGGTSSYSNNQNFTTTIYPANAIDKVTVIFNSFDVEYEASCNYDYLEIFDGTTTGATLIGKYCGTNSPGTVEATNPDGALTFHFYSDASVTNPGWEATINCIVGIQDIVLVNELLIYPNPSEDIFNLELGNITNAEIYVFDMFGKVVEQINNANDNIQLDLSTQANGIYYIKVINEGNSITRKVTLLK